MAVLLNHSPESSIELAKIRINLLERRIYRRFYDGHMSEHTFLRRIEQMHRLRSRIQQEEDRLVALAATKRNQAVTRAMSAF